MKMGCHQAVQVQANLTLHDRPIQLSQETVSISAIGEKPSTFYPSREDVIDRAGELDPQPPCHGTEIKRAVGKAKQILGNAKATREQKAKPVNLTLNV
jgi:hypothetical protein